MANATPARVRGQTGARRIEAITSPQRRAHGARGTALALLYVFLWSSAFVPSRVVAMLGQPLWVLAVRFAAASIIQVGLTFALARPWPRSKASWLSLVSF